MDSRLFHYSDRDDIATFIPRAPLRHPHAEPLVYAIDEWHSPLYFFPRDCPRIAIWPVEATSPDDRQVYAEWTHRRLLLFIEKNQESDWRQTRLVRYEFEPQDGFVDTGDHGVWVSRQTVAPTSLTVLKDLPAQAIKADAEVVIVDSLLETARRFFDFDETRFLTSLHVSMIRTSAIPTWPIPVTKPIFHPPATDRRHDRS